MEETIILNEGKEKTIIWAFLFGLLGLFLATDVIYLFTVGTTTFTLSEVYSVVLFGILLLCKKINIKEIRSTVGVSFHIFLFFVLFSGIMALVTFSSLSLFYRFIVGIISLIISLTALVDVITLYDYKKDFAKGLMIGIIITGLVCIIQYVNYQNGIKTNLFYDLFPQDNFYIYEYNFGAQGIFKEPSHMNQYLASVVPLFLGLSGASGVETVFAVILAVLADALSTSGTGMVLFVGIVLFLIAWHPFHRYVKKSSFFWFFVILIAGILFWHYFSGTAEGIRFVKNMRYYITLSSEGSNISDSSNTPRVQAMLITLGLIPRNPIGCGWNMSHTLLQQATYMNSYSSFSDLLEMTLEIGVVGVGFYLASEISSIISCFKIYSKESRGVAVAIICVIIMEALGDYAINPCIMCVLAFGMCIRYRVKSGIEA